MALYRNSSDKRVQRSGRLLFEALCKLLERKNFSEIGIREITDAAGIGRATFYRNFDYVDDILKLKVDQLFSYMNIRNKPIEVGDVKGFLVMAVICTVASS
ncbi:MAG: TetR/AcrR family transcriptional regulator [Reinekea sp.]